MHRTHFRCISAKDFDNVFLPLHNSAVHYDGLIHKISVKQLWLCLYLHLLQDYCIYGSYNHINNQQFHQKSAEESISYHVLSAQVHPYSIQTDMLGLQWSQIARHVTLANVKS